MEYAEVIDGIEDSIKSYTLEECQEMMKCYDIDEQQILSRSVDHKWNQMLAKMHNCTVTELRDESLARVRKLRSLTQERINELNS